MSLTYAKVNEVAAMGKKCAEDLKAALKRAIEFLETNSDLAIDWAAGSLPAYIQEDGDGNLSGYTFSRQQMANVIGSLNQFRNLMTNQSVTQGDHLGNVNLVAKVETTSNG